MKLKPTVGTAAGGLSKKKQPPPLATPVSTPKTRERRFLLSWRKSRKAEAGHTPSLWSRSSSKGHDHSKTTPKTQEEERQQGDAGATTTRLRRASTLDGPEGEWGFRSASVDVEAICSTSSQLTGEQALSALRPLRLLALDHRYQLAGRVLERIEAFLRQAPRDQQHATSQQEVRQAMEAEDLKALVERVRQRLRAVEEAIRELDKADDWIECARLLGVTTSYKLNADRTITVKMTGESRGSLFNQVAVLREGDFYRKWLPMCSDSRMLHTSKCEALVYLLLSSPVVTRDALLCVYAVDMADQGSVLFLGDPDGLPDVPRPDPPRGYSAGRMDIRDFRFKIDVTGPDSIQSTLIAVYDPRAPLPMSIVNFAIKRVAGAFLALIRREAQRVAADPLAHPVAQRMRSDPFYRLYLVPRMQQYYASRGWAFPPVEALQHLDPLPYAPTPSIHPPHSRAVSVKASSSNKGKRSHAMPMADAEASWEDSTTTSSQDEHNLNGHHQDQDQDGTDSPAAAAPAGGVSVVKRGAAPGWVAAWGERLVLVLMVVSLLAMLAYRLRPLLSPLACWAVGLANRALPPSLVPLVMALPAPCQ